MKRIILLLSAMLSITVAKSQEFNPHDVSKLKAFLIQPSAVAGKTNGEQLGLSAAEVASLDGSESWQWKVVGWSESVPRRVTHIYWDDKGVAGSLDVSGCEALTNLRFCDNQVTSLDASHDPVLWELVCVSNQLTSLDVSGCESLKWLSCGDNQLTALDVRGSKLLTILHCRSNRLRSLNISSCTSLENLSCQRNQLTTLDVSSCEALTQLLCHNNLLTFLDFSHNMVLSSVWCDSNPLTAMTVPWLTPIPATWIDETGATLTHLLMPDVSKATLHVPQGTKNLYRSAEVWKDFRWILEPGEVSTAEISPLNVIVYLSGTTLSVLTPVSETLTLYSSSGSLLFQSSKLPGHATFTISHLPKGVIIVKGSTGWVRKVINN
jgi:hypothetical protein